MIWYSKQEKNIERGWLSIHYKHEVYTLYEGSSIMGIYQKLNSAKQAARKYYGLGIRWEKDV